MLHMETGYSSLLLMNCFVMTRQFGPQGFVVVVIGTFFHSLDLTLSRFFLKNTIIVYIS